MGKSSTALLAATAVASGLPRVALSERGRLPSSPIFGRAATTPVSTTCPHPLIVPRGGEHVDDDDDHHRNAEANESKTSGAKKKRRRKKNVNKQHDESTSEVPPTSTENTRSTKAEKHETRPEHSDDGSNNETPPKPEKPKTIPIVEEILKEEDYYRILGITRGEVQSNPAVIKKSYRRRALQTHPDKTNGDRRAFDKVAEAYEILSDDEKRKVYDRRGKKGLHGAGPGHGFPTAEDLFRSFFGDGLGRHPFSPPSRNRTARYQLEVTLEDLYKGIVRNVAIAPPDGQGVPKQVEVNVPRGALSGQPIRLHGAMDFDPDDVPGDLIFLVHQRQHRRFTRKGHDLAVAITIGLDEALNGVTRTIRHLDGRTLTVASKRPTEHGGPMIQSGDVHVLKGQGMPKNAMGTEFGDLYVQYQVEMPKPSAAASRLSVEERAELGRLLRKLEGRVQQESSDPTDVLYLETARASDFGTASGRPEIPRDEEDEHDEHHHQFHGDPFGSPFGRGQSFYYSSTGGSSPFFGMNPEDLFRDAPPTDGECRQM